MDKSKGWANIEFNGIFFLFITMSRGMLRYCDPDVEPIYVPSDASNDLLGKSVRLSLSRSKQVELKEFQEIFKSGLILATAKEREKYTMKKYGYRTKKELYRNSDTCSVSAFDGYIEIQPTHQNSLEEWTVKADMNLNPLKVADSASDEELGAELRRAFTMCTSSVR